jgi:parallel beta-helix repeat protein
MKTNKTDYFQFKSIVYIFLIFILFSQKVEAQQTELNLKDYGISSVKDATPIVVNALKVCKENKIKKISFPKGVYHFYPTFAPDKYCAITNNDNGLKRTAFPILDFNNFEIDGNGSEFIFHGKMVPFIIEGSKDITIKNFSIDWEVSFALEGLVVENNEKDKTFDIKVTSPYKVKFGRLYLSLERESSPYDTKFGERFAIGEKNDIEVGQNIIWDPKTMAPYYNTSQYAAQERGIIAEELKPGLIRLKVKARMMPPIGSIFVSEGEHLSNRLCPAIRVFKSTNLLFNNINIHHAGAMGLIAERSEDITLDSFNVVLKPGSGRMITTTADATHFCNTKGKVIIRNCTFENMLDDATNIHGTYVRVNKIIDDYTLAVETYHPHQNGYVFAEAGDLVKIVDQFTLDSKTSNIQINKTEQINEKITFLTFSESIKGKVNLFDGIQNVSWESSALLENNKIQNNRARSFLISTSKEVIVRNNYFSSQMSALRITGDLNLWNESGPCENLLIENNTFGDCLFVGDNTNYTIMIDPEYHDKKSIISKFSKNITIKNNIFNSFKTNVLYGLSVDGLIFENNSITQSSNTYPPILSKNETIKIENCNNVSIKNNSYKSSLNEKGSIKFDDKSSNFKISKNSGFQK